MEIILTLARYVLLAGVYGGVVVVGMAIFAMKAAEGETPSMPTATMCIVNLSVQYFAVFLLMLILSLMQSRTYPSRICSVEALELSGTPPSASRNAFR